MKLPELSFLALMLGILVVAAASQFYLFYELRKIKKTLAEDSRKTAKYLLRLGKWVEKTQQQLDITLLALSQDSKNLESALRKAMRLRPLRIIPPNLLNDYTLGGRIPIENKYRDSMYPPERPLVYTREIIDGYVIQIRERKYRFPRYGQTNLWLFDALTRHPIQGKEVAVMGSNKPWYESVVLSYGGRCTTIEYNPIRSLHPGVRTMTPAEYDRNPEQFDAALSISSFEHDGLGRYGDPLNPKGDFEAMKKMKSILKPGGLLFLAVPVGLDSLQWNAHRVYGRLRLPLLLEGWQLVESFGFDEKILDRAKNTFEPVFVLKNTP